MGIMGSMPRSGRSDDLRSIAGALWTASCHVGAEFREELREVGVEGVVVQLQCGDRFSERDWPAKAGAQSFQRAPNAIDFTVGAE